MAQLNLPSSIIFPEATSDKEQDLYNTLQDFFIQIINAFTALNNASTSDGTTGGTDSAGAGNQYVELTIGSTTYKVLHDGTV